VVQLGSAILNEPRDVLVAQGSAGDGSLGNVAVRYVFGQQIWAKPNLPEVPFCGHNCMVFLGVIFGVFGTAGQLA
jgi:hypothetical protein